MPDLGFDYSWSHPSPQALKDAGASFVCRYLSNDPSKNLSSSEVQALHALGIAVVCNWETTAIRAESGSSGGVADAQAALAEANTLGLPADRPIYFSVDEGTTVGPAVAGYFQGVASVLGHARTGAYGGFQVIKGLFDAGLIAWGWQTFAWSSRWDGHSWVIDWDPRAQLRQIENGITVGGVQVDRNESQTADFGQWPMQGDDVTPQDLTMIEKIVQDTVAAGVKYTLTVLLGPTPPGDTGPASMGAIKSTLNTMVGKQKSDGSGPVDPTHFGLGDIGRMVTAVPALAAAETVQAVTPAIEIAVSHAAQNPSLAGLTGTFTVEAAK